MSPEFVMVPVPPDRVRDVYALLAGVDQPKPTGEKTEVASPDSELLYGGWTREMIARAYRESPERMTRFFDFLAANPGKTVSSEDTARAVGYSVQQQAGMMGAFGNRTRSRYKMETWFFEARYGASGAAEYRIGAAEAAALKR